MRNSRGTILVQQNTRFPDLKNIKIHDHICLLYETQAEQFSAVIPFIQEGIEKGERCIYIADDKLSTWFLKTMRRSGRQALRKRALAVFDKQETHMSEGVFDPDIMINFLEKAATNAVSEGFSALRIVCEITWTREDEPSKARLIEYHAKLDRFFSKSTALAIFQYNMNNYNPELLIQTVRVHPALIRDNRLLNNPQYIAAEELLRGPMSELRAEIENINKINKTKNFVRGRHGYEKLPLFTKALAEALDGFQITDLEGRIIYANQASSEILGFSIAEMNSMHVDDLNADKNFAKDVIIPSIKKTGRWSGELIIKRKDESELPVWLTTSLTKDEDGTPIAMVGEIRDISHLKHQEEELEKERQALESSEKKYRALVENIPSVV